MLGITQTAALVDIDAHPFQVEVYTGEAGELKFMGGLRMPHLRYAPSNQMDLISALLPQLRRLCLEVAEREGFEPPEPFGSIVFKTTAFGHSAISPNFITCV